MNSLTIKRVHELPTVFTPSTVYIAKNATHSNLIDLVLTGNDALEIRRAVGIQDIQSEIISYLSTWVPPRALKADALSSPFKLSLTGDVTGTVNITGDVDVNIVTKVVNAGTPGEVPESVPYSVIFKDTFTSPGGTPELLTDHVPEIGGPWVSVSNPDFRIMEYAGGSYLRAEASWPAIEKVKYFAETASVGTADKLWVELKFLSLNTQNHDTSFTLVLSGDDLLGEREYVEFHAELDKYANITRTSFIHYSPVGVATTHYENTQIGPIGLESSQPNILIIELQDGNYRCILNGTKLKLSTQVNWMPVSLRAGLKGQFRIGSSENFSFNSLTMGTGNYSDGVVPPTDYIEVNDLPYISEPFLLDSDEGQWFKLNLKYKRSLSVDTLLSHEDSDTAIGIFDDLGFLITTNDDSDHDDTGYRSSIELPETLEPGVYWIYCSTYRTDFNPSWTVSPGGGSSESIVMRIGATPSIPGIGVPEIVEPETDPYLLVHDLFNSEGTELYSDHTPDVGDRWISDSPTLKLKGGALVHDPDISTWQLKTRPLGFSKALWAEMKFSIPHELKENVSLTLDVRGGFGYLLERNRLTASYSYSKSDGQSRILFHNLDNNTNYGVHLEYEPPYPLAINTEHTLLLELDEEHFRASFNGVLMRQIRNQNYTPGLLSPWMLNGFSSELYYQATPDQPYGINLNEIKINKGYINHPSIPSTVFKTTFTFNGGIVYGGTRTITQTSNPDNLHIETDDGLKMWPAKVATDRSFTMEFKPTSTVNTTSWSELKFRFFDDSTSKFDFTFTFQEDEANGQLSKTSLVFTRDVAAGSDKLKLVLRDRNGVVTDNGIDLLATNGISGLLAPDVEHSLVLADTGDGLKCYLNWVNIKSIGDYSRRLRSTRTSVAHFVPGNFYPGVRFDEASITVGELNNYFNNRPRTWQTVDTIPQTSISGNYKKGESTWYNLTLTEEKSVSIDTALSKVGKDTSLRLFDESGVLIQENDDSEIAGWGKRSLIVTPPLQPGVYWVSCGTSPRTVTGIEQATKWHNPPGVGAFDFKDNNPEGIVVRFQDGAFQHLPLPYVVFLGEVSSDAMITGDALASAIGLTAGTSQHSGDSWLKWEIDGKIVYYAKKPYRYGLSWSQLNAANAVNGSRTIVIQGQTYTVSLPKGANPTPNVYVSTGYDVAYSHGSEWNRLMYPITQSTTQNPQLSQEGPDQASYTAADLSIEPTSNGRYSWCQDVYGGIPDSYVSRGMTSAAYLQQVYYTQVYEYLGWRPRLELVTP